MEKISIIIPAYNEEKRIKETLDSNLKFFKTLKKNKILNFEIIAVINGSSDKTIEIVKELAKKNNELKYLNLKRGAKGYAVIEGFKEALKSDSNLIGFKDADMATSPEAFYELVKKINNYEGIIASRYVQGSIINPKPTLERIFASRILYIMKKLGFKIKEIPTRWSDKEYSKVNFAKSGPVMFLAIIRLRILNSPFKSLIKFYDGVVNASLRTRRRLK